MATTTAIGDMTTLEKGSGNHQSYLLPISQSMQKTIEGVYLHQSFRLKIAKESKRQMR
jgi:hypothetical protein